MRLPEWSDARSAAIWLGECTPKHLNENVGVFLRRESANKPGTRTARSGGWRYHRADLERVKAIMEALGCGALRAAQHLHAIKVFRDRELLERLLEAELDQTLEREQARRFQ